MRFVNTQLKVCPVSTIERARAAVVKQAREGAALAKTKQRFREIKWKQSYAATTGILFYR